MSFRKAFFALCLALYFAPSLLIAQSLEWEYHERIDPMTDEDNSFAGTAKGNNEMLIVRCAGADDYDIIVGVGTYLGSDPANVAYRFDDDDPVNAGKWTPGTEGTVAFAPTSGKQDVLEGLQVASKVIFQITKFNGSKPHSEFSLSGSSSAINQLNCID